MVLLRRKNFVTVFAMLIVKLQEAKLASPVMRLDNYRLKRYTNLSEVVMSGERVSGTVKWFNDSKGFGSVSYTHLTLPTICSV